MSEEDKKMEEEWDPEAAQLRAQKMGLKMPITFRFTETDVPGMDMDAKEPKENQIEYTKPRIVNRPKNKNALF